MILDQVKNTEFICTKQPFAYFTLPAIHIIIFEAGKRIRLQAIFD